MNSSRRRVTRSQRHALLVIGLAAASTCFSAAVATAAPGELDRGFGHGGRVAADLGRSDEAVATTSTANGKTITAGTVVVGGAMRPVVARFQGDGDLDPTFGDGGAVVLDIPGDEARATDVALAANGRILVSATVRDGVSRTVAVALRRDGSPDAGFGADGVAPVAFGDGPSSLFAELAVAEDGKIVVAGATGANFGVARLTADGQPDDSFSDDGREVTDLGGSDWVKDVAIAPGGAIVVAGLTGEEVIPNDPDGWNEDLAVVRYLPQGGLDPEFSDDGVQTWGLSGPDEGASALAVLADGSTLAAGYTADGVTDTTLVRFTPGGELDASFGAHGVRTIDLAGRARNRPDRALAIAVDGAGRALVGGSATTGAKRSTQDFGLARFRADGRLDRSFGNVGRVTTDFGGRDYATAITLDSQDRIVLAGSTLDRGSGDTAVARYRG